MNDIKIRHGDGTTEYGPGVLIEMSGNDVARAIDNWLYDQGVAVRGARTIRIGGELCKPATIYVDPSGYVSHGDCQWDGRGLISSQTIDCPNYLSAGDNPHASGDRAYTGCSLCGMPRSAHAK